MRSRSFSISLLRISWPIETGGSNQVLQVLQEFEPEFATEI